MRPAWMRWAVVAGLVSNQRAKRRGGGQLCIAGCGEPSLVGLIARDRKQLAERPEDRPDTCSIERHAILARLERAPARTVPGEVIRGLRRVGNDSLGRAEGEIGERPLVGGGGEPRHANLRHVDQRLHCPEGLRRHRPVPVCSPVGMTARDSCIQRRDRTLARSQIDACREGLVVRIRYGMYRGGQPWLAAANVRFSRSQPSEMYISRRSESIVPMFRSAIT
jgi:hypothetical protein